MFPDDDRVVALFADARRKFGDDILRDPRRSVPLLADRAPELRGVIKAVAGAISIGAAQRLGATPDQAGEFHRLASEVTGREGVSFADATAGVRIAARIAGIGPGPGLGPVPMTPPEDRSWVGGGATLVGGAGNPPRPAPGHGAAPGYGAPGVQPPPGGPGYGAPGYGTPGYGQPGMPPTQATPGFQEFMKGKWGVAALVGVAVLVVVGLSSHSGQTPQGPQAPPSGPPPSQPTGGPPPQTGGPPPQGGNLPIIVAPGGGRQPPAIMIQDAQQAYVLEFGASAGNQIFRVIVGVSKQGWDAGFVAVGSQGARQPESVSQPAPFKLSRQNNNAIRVLQPQWQRDGLNIGAICVAFIQSGAADVQLRGSNVCVLANSCNQMVGCGVVQ
jgi:hypothetical protein